MKKISSKYLIILGILSVVILVSQLLIQKTIKDNKSDSRIINISGRQRMLSQKITKAALKLKNAGNASGFTQAQNELATSVNLLSRSHAALQNGDPNMDLGPALNSNQILKLFDEVEPLFNIISNSAKVLLGYDYNDFMAPEKAQAINISLQGITNNESSFLKLMNDITFQYDLEASQKVERLSTSEYYLLGFTFLLILLEAFFIFRPMVKDVNIKDQQLTDLGAKMEKSLKAAGLHEEEKKYASSQISQANDKITQLRKLVYEMKDKLDSQEKNFTLKLGNRIAENASLSEQHQRALVTIKELKTKTPDSRRTIA